MCNPLQVNVAELLNLGALSMVRGKPVEITAFVIRVAWGFEAGIDLAGRKPVHGYHRRYSRYGLNAADHKHDGNRVTALHPDYQIRVQALGDAIGFKQRHIFVSNNTLEHMFAAEEVGTHHQPFDWSHFVLTNLRLHLVYIHS